MTPDLKICDRCTLPECDIYARLCGLRRNANLVDVRQRKGLSNEPEAKAAALIWIREYQRDCSARRSENAQRAVA